MTHGGRVKALRVATLQVVRPAIRSIDTRTRRVGFGCLARAGLRVICAVADPPPSTTPAASTCAVTWRLRGWGTA